MDKASQYLMQKSEATDAVIIQRNMDTFNHLLVGVLGRLAETHTQLQKISVSPGAEYELQLRSISDPETSDQDTSTYVSFTLATLITNQPINE